MNIQEATSDDIQELAVHHKKMFVEIFENKGQIISTAVENGIEKVYDCSNVFSRPQFQLLRNQAFFKAVHVDPGGYGVSWNDDLDLSEYELWTNGKTR